MERKSTCHEFKSRSWHGKALTKLRFFLGKMRAMQSIIELDLPKSLANEIDESVRPEYLKLLRSVQPRRE
ncbi:hypothetical protein QUB33_26525 [Microcoleus sp. B3-A4]|uniref:hypothetical protein n=1 Tax=Microcoleus sp. B3-A4 TaxID=2818653 RepID=UPI002FCF3CBB